MIDRFVGKYYFLSNMYVYSSIGKSVEHYFQAGKTTNSIDYNYIVSSVDGYEAKRRGKKIAMRSDWLECRDSIMYEEVALKFYVYENLRDMLLNTGDEMLVEGNTWGDKYWGVDIKTGIGENKLGKILMKVREEIK